MTRIPLHNLFERFLQLENIDSEKGVEEVLAMFKYDPILKAKFDKFLKNLDTTLKEQYKK